MRYLSILVIIGIFLSNWYYNIDVAEYIIEDVRTDISLLEARAALMEPTDKKKSFFYEQKVTYKRSRTMIPFVFNMEEITRGKRKYSSR